MSKQDCDHEHHPANCGCTDLTAEGPEPTTCTGSIRIPTLEEQHILAQIRETQEEAQAIKETMRQLESQLNPPEDRLTELRDQLQALRQRRSSLEEQRVRAAHERMRLLGHA